MSRGPIFIVGAMGAGTTLLRLVLDSHPNIAVPQETGFMRAYNAHIQIPFKWSGRNWATRMGWSPEELDRELAAFYERIFMRYVKEQGKQRWGEKCPLHTWHIDNMGRLYPDAVFVGVVRHPGACSASIMSRFGHSLSNAASHYERYHKEVARQAARHRDRFVVLRYEQLVMQPEVALRELLGWLGEPWSELVLAHNDVQAARGGKQVVEGRTRVTDPIDASRIDKWTRALGRNAQRELKLRLSRLGEFYGYAWDDPACFEPLHPGSLLAGGTDIAERIERYPELDIETPLPPSRYERLYHPRELQLADARVRGAKAAEAQWSSTLRRAAMPVVRRLPSGARRRLSTAARALEAARRDGAPGRPG